MVCPVCRNRMQLINGMPVTWKDSLEEPSKELGTIYELVYNENGILTKDWEGNLPINVNLIDKNNKMLLEKCGGSGSYSGCGGDGWGVDPFNLEDPKSEVGETIYIIKVNNNSNEGEKIQKFLNSKNFYWDNERTIYDPESWAYYLCIEPKLKRMFCVIQKPDLQYLKINYNIIIANDFKELKSFIEGDKLGLLGFSKNKY